MDGVIFQISLDIYQITAYNEVKWRTYVHELDAYVYNNQIKN